MQSAQEILAHLNDIRNRLSVESETTEYAYMSRELVQCTLPHTDPGNEPVWKRQNGNLTLSLLPGRDEFTGKSLGYPYGALPRYLLFWIVTEAVQTKSPHLILGSSLSDFMRELGLNPSNGGPRSDAWRLKEQTRRLFECEIKLIHTGVTNGIGFRSRQGMKIVKGDYTCWSKKSPGQAALLENSIVLTEDFFRAARKSAVPYQLEALRQLGQQRHSPLLLDLYTLSGFKTFHAARLQREQMIPWSGLLAQLGANYHPGRMDNFQAKIKSAMQKVAAVFAADQLQVEYRRPDHRDGHEIEGGIVFLPVPLREKLSTAILEKPGPDR